MAHGRAGLPHLLPDHPHLFLLGVTLTDACELTVELDAAGRLNVRAGPGWREDPAPGGGPSGGARTGCPRGRLPLVLSMATRPVGPHRSRNTSGGATRAAVVVLRQPWSSGAALTSGVGTSQTCTNLSVCAGSHRGRGRHVFTTPPDGTAPTRVRAVGARQRRGPSTGRPVSGTARTRRHGDAAAGPTLTGG